MEFAPRPLKRFLPTSDDERSFKRFAADPEDGASSSGEDSVDSYGYSATVTLGDDSPSESGDESSVEGFVGVHEPRKPPEPMFFDYCSESEVDDGVEDFFADRSSESDDDDEGNDVGPDGSSDGGLFLIVPRRRKCNLCGKEKEGNRTLTCKSCWTSRKVKTGAPPIMKKKRSKTSSQDIDLVAPEQACAVCYVQPKTLTLVHGNTGHKCVCYDCAGRLLAMAIPKRRCPVCREIFTSVKLNRGIKEFRRVNRAGGKRRSNVE